MAATQTVAGVALEIEERGHGRPLLFLHAGEGLGAERPWLDLLSRHYRVIAPSHPGFGQSSLPDWIGTVDDLAYLYLDLAEKLRLEDAIITGASFGGWIAAEMLVRSTARFSKVVLASPLGIKVTGRETRDIADMHGMTEAAYRVRAWAEPRLGEVDAAKLSEPELRALVRGRESLALFGWKPYMHNPRLKPWLHRIDKPTLLLWGAADGIVTPAYREGWSLALPQAKTATIAHAGHYPHWEQAEAFAAAVVEFAKS